MVRVIMKTLFLIYSIVIHVSVICHSLSSNCRRKQRIRFAADDAIYDGRAQNVKSPVKMSEFGCTRPKCCDVQKHLVETQREATNELGRALRTAVQRGDDLEEGNISSGKDELISGVYDEEATERALLSKANSDLAVADQSVESSEKELNRINRVHENVEKEERDFENQRMTTKQAEVEHEDENAQLLDDEVARISDAVKEELAALNAEEEALEVEEKNEEAKVNATLDEVDGEGLKKASETHLRDGRDESDVKIREGLPREVDVVRHEARDSIDHSKHIARDAASTEGEISRVMSDIVETLSPVQSPKEQAPDKTAERIGSNHPRVELDADFPLRSAAEAEDAEPEVENEEAEEEAAKFLGRPSPKLSNESLWRRITRYVRIT